MAGCIELKKIAYARIRTTKALMCAGDFDSAAYMMGYALEIALKAAACKALRLDDYPSNTRNKSIDNYFMSHKFDQLLVISGTSDLFNINGPVEAFRNWSEFVQEYLGDWPAMRYDPNAVLKFDPSKVARLYRNLYNDSNSIIRTLTRRRRW